jgi:hypothetical protein
MNKSQEYLCAVDIEALGRANSMGVLSIGFCYGTTWEDRKKHRISILPDKYHNYHEKAGQTWDYLKVANAKIPLTEFIQDVCEPGTWKEFWSNHVEVLETLFAEAYYPKVAYEDLSNFIKKIYSVESKEEKKYRVVFLGDNPSYDFGRIDYVLEKYCDELPLRYSNREKIANIRGGKLLNDGYHAIKDPSERAKYFKNDKAMEKVMVNHAKHSHMPDDDAELIYLQYLLMKDENLLKKLSVSQ